MTQLFLDFETCKDTVGANYYCQTPSTLLSNIKNRYHFKFTAGIILLHDSAQPHMFTSFSCMCLTYQEVKFISKEARKRNEYKKLMLWECQFVYKYFQMFIPGQGYSTGTTLDFSITTHLKCTETANSFL